MWSPTLLAVLLAAGAIALAIVLHLTGSERRSIRDFQDWVSANASALQSGPVTYQDVDLDLDNEVTQFRAIVSFVKFTVTLPSRPYFVGYDSVIMPALGFTLCSVLLGWWGFPWGPFETIAAVYANLTGGDRQRIRELVAVATGHSRTVFRLTPAAAEAARRVIADRGFAPATALRLVPIEPTVGDYAIQYDLPDNDGRDWQSQSEGLLLLVDKRAVEELDLGEIVVDFTNGRFTFERAWERYKWGSPAEAKGQDLAGGPAGTAHPT
jgi:hypothetical protein